MRLCCILLTSLLLLSSRIQAQPGFSYKNYWSRVDTLILKKGLMQDALQSARTLYQRARQEKNVVQQTRALLYQIYLLDQMEEDPFTKHIRFIEREMRSAPPLLKALLNTYEARLYQNYLESNRYRIYGRAETNNDMQSDPATWSAGDFRKKISYCYRESLRDEKLLQQTRLNSFGPLLIPGNTRHLRPTLYDLLAYRCLEYLESDEPGITEPERDFEIPAASAFADASLFVRLKFDELDSSSLKQQALALQQKLLLFHLKDPDPRALIEADLHRLEFVYQHASHPHKDSLFLNTLQQLPIVYAGHPATDQALYRVAQWHADQENNEPLSDIRHRVIARDLCTRVLQNRDSSEGKVNCRRLIRELELKDLSLQIEKVNLPGQPFRALVSYRNVDGFYIRIIPVSDEQYKSLQTGDSYHAAYWEQLRSLAYRTTYQQELIPTQDLREHRVEIKLEELPYGQYALLTSLSEDFSTSGNLLTMQTFHVSRIGWIQEANRFYLLDRETGSPLPGSTVTMWYREYNFQTRSYETLRGESGAADSNGLWSINTAQLPAGRSCRLEVTNGNDHLMLNDDVQVMYRDEVPVTEKKSFQSFLFTDRAIYRPGQLLLFKGLVTVKTGHNTPQLATDFSTVIYLKDAHARVTDSVSVSTSPYGSYSGRFTLPAGKLNGTFTLYDAAGNLYHTITVEEYKRPGFRVSLLPPSTTYKINDTLSVSGRAVSYTGQNLDHVAVTYRVIRRTFYPMPMAAYGFPWGNTREISHGTTTTDASGNFQITFTALPDALADRRNQPVFYFEVQADVTDRQGETRSERLSVPVAWQSLFLSIEAKETLPVEQFRMIRIGAQNLNGSPIAATCRVSLHPLQQPNRLFRSRYWPQPDQFLFTEDTYHRYFPLDIYNREDDPSTWPEENPVMVLTHRISSLDTLAWPATLKIKAGWYQLKVVTSDAQGVAVTASRILQLTGPEATAVQFYGNVAVQDTFRIEDSIAPYALLTNIDNLTVIHSTRQLNEEAETRLVQIPKGSKSLRLRLSNPEQGSVYLSMSFIRHNRYFFREERVPLAHPEKNLTVRYSSYRDKTRPGSEEQWTITVEGLTRETGMAEVLTAMYDASLDQFKNHNWILPTFWRESPPALYYSGDPGFGIAYSIQRNFSPVPEEAVYKRYEHLMDLHEIPAASPVLPTAVYRQTTGEAGVMAQAAEIQEDQSASTKGVATPTDSRERKPQQLPARQQLPEAIPLRKNFNETAFFFPQLSTDSSGNLTFSFTVPEALTEWRWMTLAHTRNRASGYLEKKILTQKELMVQSQNPRFMREGDRMDYSAKIVNLTAEEITGQVELQLIDPETGKPVDGWFRNFFPNQYFTVPPQGSVPASFSIEIPYQYNRPVTARITVRSGMLSDGEETIIPVISNRIMVTESLPFSLQIPGTKQEIFSKLQQTDSETLNHHALTVEFTGNPAWYALMALPYLAARPYESSEQIFNRLYANSLGFWLIQNNRQLKNRLSQWKKEKADSALSPLEKNEELKSITLEETPWLQEARTESESRHQVALFMDSANLVEELRRNGLLLQTVQTPNGGFSWFPGGPDDRYITQYILSGLGQLMQLGAVDHNDAALRQLVGNGVRYLDGLLKEEYQRDRSAIKSGTPPSLSPLSLHYLFMRSCLNDFAIDSSVMPAYRFYLSRGKEQWLQQPLYLQGIIALTVFRKGDAATARNILKSIRQKAIQDPELGMYWKNFQQSGYSWSEAGVEAHALLTEAFSEIEGDPRVIQELHKWLLRQKQTRGWHSTKATASACYVLLKEHSGFSAADVRVRIRLGDQDMVLPQPETGSGYVNATLAGTAVKKSMAVVTITADAAGIRQPQPAWGAVYWQYFENLNQITPSSARIQVKKLLFRQVIRAQGPVLELLRENDRVHPGEKIIVRMELQSDRPMEYVHVKDMRAAGFEPEAVLSGYQWQGGLGYYQTIKDAATHFFIAQLPKGSFVLEYPLRVTHTGTFSNGLTTVQCLYAPEYTSHTEGIRLLSE